MADYRRAKASRISLTPEEKISRALRARCRFKAMVRFVLQNLYWLQDIEEEELGDNVKKNVLLITRKKSMRQGLTLQDKYILSKSTECRTEEDKLRVDCAIGGLKCFRKYPKDVKSRLTGVTYFCYYEPGRTVVRQGHQSEALYFITTGYVDIFQEHFDPVLNENTVQHLGTKGPGSMFGEVALLNNIPRTATIVTNTHCELLCLKKQDFEVVLKATVQQQWDEMQQAMREFTYFQYWNEMSIRECCVLSKMNFYAADETILGDGEGLLDHVYFVLKGKCVVIEHLRVIPFIRNGRKHWKLYESSLTPSVEDVSESNRAFSTTKARGFGSIGAWIMEKPNAKNKETGNAKNSSLSTSNKSKSTSLHPEPSVHFEIPNSRSVSQRTSSLEGKTKEAPCSRKVPCTVEDHFMQVCFLNTMACFGIGENMENRRIVALVPTQCLLIPRYWLMQRNIGNVWHKLEHFLINHIPTTSQVLEEFIQQRRWMAFRKKTFNECLKRKLSKFNSLSNVPYFNRIHEEINFD